MLKPLNGSCIPISTTPDSGLCKHTKRGSTPSVCGSDVLSSSIFSSPPLVLSVVWKVGGGGTRPGLDPAALRAPPRPASSGGTALSPGEGRGGQRHRSRGSSDRPSTVALHRRVAHGARALTPVLTARQVGGPGTVRADQGGHDAASPLLSLTGGRVTPCSCTVQPLPASSSAVRHPSH